ncbi:hypothetical protein ABH940_003226 [Streptacidiphilus sp. BW17]|uniref:hypothetical protein n=1 Tax=unclassified Streptacidiphilus TaxID=2643834 RepID=UPI0035168F05
MRAGEPARERARPVYHPAGRDDALRAALEDLQAGRWMATRELLSETGTNWGLRSARSQILAAAAVRSDVLGAWLMEEPESANAVVMQARVAVERALRAHRHGRAQTGSLEQRAREWCWRAAQLAPQDPVPWVCLLALAQVDEQQARPEHYAASPERLLPPGPWGLLGEAHRLDPCNREAFHRMLRFWLSRPGGSVGASIDFVRWVVSWAPVGSALLVLPLHAYAEHFRRQRERVPADPLLRRLWTRDHIARDAERALHLWFDETTSQPRLALDLNHLAHALSAAHRPQDAARVFDAIGPYATRLPWAHMADDPALAEREFAWARSQAWAAVAASGGRP